MEEKKLCLLCDEPSITGGGGTILAHVLEDHMERLILCSLVWMKLQKDC